MISIRSKLLFSLWLAITGMIFITGFWTYQNSVQQLSRYFDNQLIQRTMMLHELHQQAADLPQLPPLLDTLVNQHSALKNKFHTKIPIDFSVDQLTFVFQIWDKNTGELQYKSKLAPQTKLAEFNPGFADSDIENHQWRTFTLVDKDLIYIMAELSTVRSMLIDHIAFTQEFPMLTLLVFLLILSCLGIRWSLRPLERISEEISQRHPDFLSHISETSIPVETRAMVAQINHLFSRLAEGFERERRFTADASHELRTPIAALKIQAQVALESRDEKERKKILEKIILGVDRCTHIIQQLGTLAQLKPQDGLTTLEDVKLDTLAAEVMAELAPYAIQKHIEIALQAETTALFVPGNPILIRVMLRNIIDNAIRYCEDHKKITVQIFREAEALVLRVEDRGPGIPEELRERIFERFYRGLGHQAPGSGLGLAIVEQIANLHKATIRLTDPQTGETGLCFDVLFYSFHS